LLSRLTLRTILSFSAALQQNVSTTAAVDPRVPRSRGRPPCRCYAFVAEAKRYWSGPGAIDHMRPEDPLLVSACSSRTSPRSTANTGPAAGAGHTRRTSDRRQRVSTLSAATGYYGTGTNVMLASEARPYLFMRRSPCRDVGRVEARADQHVRPARNLLRAGRSASLDGHGSGSVARSSDRGPQTAGGHGGGQFQPELRDGSEGICFSLPRAAPRAAGRSHHPWRRRRRWRSGHHPSHCRRW